MVDRTGWRAACCWGWGSHVGGTLVPPRHAALLHHADCPQGPGWSCLELVKLGCLLGLVVAGLNPARAGAGLVTKPSKPPIQALFPAAPLPAPMVLSPSLPHTHSPPPLTPATPPAGGVIDPEATMDREEADECRKMHGIMEQYGLQHCFRWIIAQARWGVGGAGRVGAEGLSRGPAAAGAQL